MSSQTIDPATVRQATSGQLPHRGAGRRLRRTIIGSVATVLALFFVGTAPAVAGGPFLYASGGSIGERLTVCAHDLYVRHTRGGTPFAHLNDGQTFTVEGVDSEFGSEWVYGFAYGDVNARGYVENGWFCYG